MERRARRAWRGLVAGLAIAASLVSAAAAAPDPAALSRVPLKADPTWRGHVRHLDAPYVSAAAVFAEGRPGAVRDVDGLLRGRGATLTSAAAGDARIVVDLGRLASGYVEVTVRSARGGPIRIAYAEGRQYLGKWGDASDDPHDFFYRGRTLAPEDDPDGRADVFQPSANRTVLRSPGIRGSERYVAISLDGPGSVTVEAVRVRQTNRTDAYDGHFLSSDTRLNDAWYASAYALELSTIRDLRGAAPGPWVIVDGPKRDRVPYIADLAFVAFSAYAQSNAYRDIVRDTFNLFACRQYPDGALPALALPGSPCPLGDPGPPKGPPQGYMPGESVLARLDGFTAYWVPGLADYVRFTGDTAYAKPLLPVARRVVAMLESHVDAHGLFVTGNYDHKIGFNWHTPDRASGVGAWDNEAFYAALTGMAQLERTVAGDEAAANVLDKRAETLKAAILDALWDPQVGAMRLNLSDPSHDHTADANAFALALGILDPPRARQAMAFLSGPLATPYGTANSEHAENPFMTQYVSPYVMAAEAVGRFRYGDGAGALALFRKAWPYMIEHGPGTPWEEVSVKGDAVVPRVGTSLAGGGQVDLAHAWSTVVPGLSMFILGVTPAADGFSEWTVAPQPVDLSWAQGSVPTPRGPIDVRWRRKGGAFVLTVVPPLGTSGRVLAPGAAAGTLAIDGRVIWRDGAPVAPGQAERAGDGVLVPALRGAHTLAWSLANEPIGR